MGRWRGRDHPSSRGGQAGGVSGQETSLGKAAGEVAPHFGRSSLSLPPGSALAGRMGPAAPAGDLLQAGRACPSVSGRPGSESRRAHRGQHRRGQRLSGAPSPRSPPSPWTHASSVHPNPADPHETALCAQDEGLDHAPARARSPVQHLPLHGRGSRETSLPAQQARRAQTPASGPISLRGTCLGHEPRPAVQQTRPASPAPVRGDLC